MPIIVLVILSLSLASCATNRLPECESMYQPVGYRDIPTPCIGTYTKGGQVGTAVRMVVVRDTAGRYVCQEVQP